MRVVVAANAVPGAEQSNFSTPTAVSEQPAFSTPTENEELCGLSPAPLASPPPLSRDHITQPSQKPNFRRSSSLRLTRRQSSKSPLRRREKAAPELSTKVIPTGIAQQSMCQPVVHVGRAWLAPARARRRRRAATHRTVNTTTLQCSNADITSQITNSTPQNTTSSAEVNCELKRGSTQGIYNLLAGGIAAAIAAAITMPLDVIKTQIQVGAGLGVLGVASKIITEQGMSGLYRGLTPTMLGTVPLRAFYFWAMIASRALFTPFFGEGPTLTFLSSFFAGMLRSVVASPLYTVKTRMQATNSAGFSTTALAIFQQHGLSGFYRGVLLSYWGIAEGGIQSLIYEGLKRRWGAVDSDGKAKSDARVKLLMAAAISKVVSSGLLYPHEVILTKMSASTGSALVIISLTWQTQGFAGLWAGIGAHLLRTVPNTAVMFVLFELLQTQLPFLTQRRVWEPILARFLSTLAYFKAFLEHATY